MAQGGTVSLAHDGECRDVAVVTLSNTRIANAIDAAMLADMEQLPTKLAGFRAVVITGDGDRHFCSGADINAWGPMEPADFAANWVGRGIRAFAAIARLPALVIAAINGTCFGGGLELALHADVRHASRAARFAFPETGVGAVPGWRGGAMLAGLAGRGLAAEMVMGGRVLGAGEALQAGVVSAVYEPGELMDHALGLARRSAKRSWVANAAAKRLLDAGGDMDAVHEREGALCKASADGKEGLEAFAEKRDPKFHAKP